MAATTTISQTQLAVPGTRARSKAHARAAMPIRFATAPALLPACAFALGVLLVRWHWIAPAWLLLGLFPLAATIWWSTRLAPRVLLPALAAVFTVLGYLAGELQPPIDPQQQLSTLAEQAVPLTLTGEVVRLEAVHRSAYIAFFQRTKRDEIEQRMDLRVHSYTTPDWKVLPVQGGIRMSMYAEADAQLPALHCGSRVAATLTLREESRYGDPGVWDASEYMHGQGIGAIGSTGMEKVRLVGQGKPSIACLLHALQSEASERVMKLAELPGSQRLPPFLKLSADDASMLTCSEARAPVLSERDRFICSSFPACIWRSSPQWFYLQQTGSAFLASRAP